VKHLKRALALLAALTLLLSGCSLPQGKVGTTVGQPVSTTPTAQTGTAAPQPGQAPPGTGDAPADPNAPRTPHQPVQVKGLYMTGYIAGGDKSFHDLLTYMKSSGLNAVVIDVKDDDGLVTFAVDVPAVKESGANKFIKVSDMPGRIKELHDNGIYTIGRIVTYVDPVLAKWRPDWAIQDGGRVYYDSRRLPWGNPYKKEVWQYNVDIAKAAVKAGFDEIQFDYVRFPEKHIQGFNYGVGRDQRVNTITGFLKYAHDELKPLGVYVAADVFGLTTTVVDDMMIGQEYRAVSETVDYICPMVYPSHYNPGLFGLKNPNAAPYETVYQSMLRGLEKADGLDISKHRPWIQDFSLYGVKYGKAEIEAQIKALANAGVRQFILWDPNNKYIRGVDYSLIDSTPALPHPKPEPKPAENGGTGSSGTTGGNTSGASGSNTTATP